MRHVIDISSFTVIFSLTYTLTLLEIISMGNRCFYPQLFSMLLLTGMRSWLMAIECPSLKDYADSRTRSKIKGAEKRRKEDD